MLDITLLNNSDWRLIIRSGGFGRVEVTNADGTSVLATREEKNFLQDLMRCIANASLPRPRLENVRERLFADFSRGLFEKNSSGSSRLYHMFIGNGPELSVHYYMHHENGFVKLAGNSNTDGM